jgi:hypothetical protein
MTETASPTYEELGIYPDTWACIAVGMSKRDAADYLWRLALAGVPAVLALDADGKRWHVAIAGGLKASPKAWLLSIRPDDDPPVKCPADARGQHVRGGVGPCQEEWCSAPSGHTSWHVAKD